MTEQEFIEAVDSLSAYDHGCTDTRIHDEALKAKVFDQLDAWDDKTEVAMLDRLFQKLFFTDEALAQGYGIRDAINLVEWFTENGYDI